MKCKSLFIPFCIFLITLSCKEKDKQTDTVVSKIPVSTCNVQEKDYTPSLSSFGSITQLKAVKLTTLVTGTLEQLNFEAGDFIKRGDVFCRLENIQMEIQVQQAETELNSAITSRDLADAKYREAKIQIESQIISIEKSEIEIQQKNLEIVMANKKLNQKKELLLAGGVSKEDIENSELQLKSQESQLKLMKKDLELKQIGFRDQDIITFGYTIPDLPQEKNEILTLINTKTQYAELQVAQDRVLSSNKSLSSVKELLGKLTIRSRISGIVGERSVEIGENIPEKTQVATIIDTSSVYAVFSIQASELSNIKIGKEIVISVDALKPDTLTGKIRLISPIIDPQTGNVQIKAIISNVGYKLIPGMFFTTTIHTGENEKLLIIPESAILSKESNTATVFIVNNGKAFQKTVKLGRQLDEGYEIILGIDLSDKVIDNPSPVLKEGEDVEIRT